MKDEDRDELEGNSPCQCDVGDTSDFCNLICPNKTVGDDEQGYQPNAS